MSSRINLRPVIVTYKGEEIKGFFHRFVFSSAHNYSVTQALVEHADGRLRYYDPYLVQFADRKPRPKE